jgi:hypothetical protein
MLIMMSVVLTVAAQDRHDERALRERVSGLEPFIISAAQRYGVYLSSLKTVVSILMVIVGGVISVAAQTPSGTFFDGNSAQLGNSLRSITFFLAAAMIIAGIIFVAVGIITSGLRESLSTWKFITGAACFAFGGICAAVYAFSQGETVPLDNQF